MPFVIDIIFAVILLVSIADGIVKGFVETALNLLSGAIAFIVAYTVSPIIAPTIAEKAFQPLIQGTVYDKIIQLVPDGNAEPLFEGGETGGAFANLLAGFGAEYEKIAEMFEASVAEKAEIIVTSVSEYVATPIATAVAYALTFFAVFAVVMIVLFIVKKALNLVAKLPVIKTANKILGGVTGFISAAVTVFTLSLLLSLGLPYLNTIDASAFPIDLEEKSFFLRIFCSDGVKTFFSNIIDKIHI